MSTLIEAFRRRTGDTSRESYSEMKAMESTGSFSEKRIDMRDLDGIAQRYHQEGAREGWRAGYDEGHKAGVSEIAMRERERLAGLASSIGPLLVQRLLAVLAGPSEGTDRRTRKEIAEGVVGELEQLVKELQGISVAAQRGELFT